ncbi:hypothetical protein [Roseisolibacter agri]|uniref:Uncharacterized protein n=1 Tax=Roseisolibacter agri TaxID=2014610 RepID=A0AA37V0B8_9BACT|nr:hypothetical protein [Roseisolibacter agri]GLC24145.1 hypothetical protein rosag_06580 [Roseisolibacter agri]
MASPPKPNVVSVFCAGTDYDENSKDVIAQLYAATEGRPGVDRFFYAGPGSAGAVKRHGAVVNTVDSTMKRVMPGLGVVAGAAGVNLGQVVDTATGMSMHLNVAAAEREVSAVCAPGLTTVNLAGWSRGAVTCIGIANALARRGVTSINLFLFDPVPGTKLVNSWNWTEELNTLPEAVKSTSVLLMEQMVGGISTAKELLLQPLTTAFAGGTATVYPMPGRHNSAVENDSYLPEVAALGEHLCTQFLLSKGTKLSRTRTLSDAAVVEHYATVKRSQKRVAEASGYTERSFAIDNPLRESLFFVNQHHKRTFATVYPTVAQVLDSAFEVPRWNASAADEARRIRGGSPSMKAVLLAGLGTLIAARLPTFPTNRPRRDAEDLVRLLAELQGMTAEQTQTAITVTQTPPPSLFAPRLPTATRGPTISASTSDW